jgi:hypothetical protein
MTNSIQLQALRRRMQISRIELARVLTLSTAGRDEKRLPSTRWVKGAGVRIGVALAVATLMRQRRGRTRKHAGAR